MSPNRSLSLLLVAVSALVFAACGGGETDSGSAGADDTGASDAGDGSEAASSALPAGCNNEEPLEIGLDGFPEISGPFTVAGGVALPFAMLPGEESLVDLTDDELQAAVDASDLRAYAVAVTDFAFGPDDAGPFYGIFSLPTLPDDGGTSIVLTVLPPDGPLAEGSRVEVGTELSYAEQLQTTAVSTGAYIDSNRQADVPSVAGATELFTGSVEVVALTDEAICLAWDTSSPVWGDDGGFLTISGTVSAPLLPLEARNSMG